MSDKETEFVKFIKDAYAAGYESPPVSDREPGWSPLLDPEIWKAVGKTRKWNKNKERYMVIHRGWKRQMFRFLSYLADKQAPAEGKIEWALKEIESKNNEDFYVQ